MVSADRRYVRISASPIFSGVSKVNTFNMATGASQSQTSGGNTGGGYNQAQAPASGPAAVSAAAAAPAF